MPYRQQKRNKPIASLIKWYMDKKNHLFGKTRNITVDTSISLNFSKQNMNQLP